MGFIYQTSILCLQASGMFNKGLLTPVINGKRVTIRVEDCALHLYNIVCSQVVSHILETTPGGNSSVCTFDNCKQNNFP